MKIVEAPGGRRLEIKKGGGCISIFGLPFLGAGLMIVAATFGLIGNGTSGGDMPPAAGALFGLVFAGVGATLVFGRGGLIIERDGDITSWWGLLVPWRNKQRKLADFSRVFVNKEIRRSKNSTYTVYPIRLNSMADEKGVKIGEPQNYEKARELAERIAKFTGLPLADSSSGNEVSRTADELDLSLSERLRKTGIEELPPPPANMRSIIRRKNQDVMIEIPPAKNGAITGALTLLPFLLFCIIPFVFFFVAFGRGGMDNAFPAFFLFFPIVVALPFVIFTWHRKTSIMNRTQRLIIASGDGIKIQRVNNKNGAVKEAGTMKIAELEEMTMTSGPDTTRANKQTPEFLKRLAANTGKTGIVFRGDKRSLTLPLALAPEEGRYLMALIEHTLARTR